MINLENENETENEMGNIISHVEDISGDIDTDTLQLIDKVNNCTNLNISSFAIQNQNLYSVQMSSISNLLIFDNCINDASPAYFVRKKNEFRNKFTDDLNVSNIKDKDKIQIAKELLIEKNKKNIAKYNQIIKLIANNNSENFISLLNANPDLNKYIKSEYVNKLFQNKKEIKEKLELIKMDLIDKEMKDNRKFKYEINTNTIAYADIEDEDEDLDNEVQDDDSYNSENYFENSEDSLDYI